MPLISTAVAMAGGTDTEDGRGNEYLFDVVYTPQLNDQITLVLTDTLSGLQTSIGGGYVSGIALSYLYTFNNRIFGLSGSSWYFCALGSPTVWNDPNAAGNGFEQLSNFFATAATPKAIAQFQGMLAVANRDYCLVWQVDPNPANFALTQVVPNMGTMAPLSVQAIGDMDVFMLYDSGVRSLRVRIATNNAVIADIGTPIDMLIQSVLDTLPDALKATSCATVDPAANRYWLYIPTAADNPSTGTVGKIYVFSYFTSSQVAAWSTYTPSFQTAISAPGASYPSSGAATLTYTGLTVGNQYAWNPGANEQSIVVGGAVVYQGFVFTATATMLVVTGVANGDSFTGQLKLINFFVPQKFEIYQGQVWVRDTNNNLFQYGGANNNTYENCGVNAVTPYVDEGTPGNIKTYQGLESAFVGTWRIGASADYTTQIYRNIYNNTLSTFSFKRIGWDAKGTRSSFQVQEMGTGYARLSSIMAIVAAPVQGQPK